MHSSSMTDDSMKGEVAGIFVRNLFVNAFLFKYGYINMPSMVT